MLSKSGFHQCQGKEMASDALRYGNYSRRTVRDGADWGGTGSLPPGKGMDVSYPKAPAITGKAPRITIMTAVALVRALKQAAELETGIKWPNDIVCNGKSYAAF